MSSEMAYKMLRAIQLKERVSVIAEQRTELQYEMRDAEDEYQEIMMNLSDDHNIPAAIMYNGELWVADHANYLDGSKPVDIKKVTMLETGKGEP